jgi:predicted dinucleotide-binding enzyme
MAGAMIRKLTARDAGCEPVIVGNLAAGKKFERANPGFRADTTAAKLR